MPGFAFSITTDHTIFFLNYVNLHYHHISCWPLEQTLLSPLDSLNLHSFNFFQNFIFFLTFLNTISISRRQCWLTISSPGITFTSFNTTSILVIHKNVIDHCFSFTWSKCHKSTFLFLETSIHQVQPFTSCLVQQPDPSIIYFPNPRTPTNLSKTTHITTNMEIKVTTHQPYPLVHKTPPFHLMIYQPVDNSKIPPPKLKSQ